MIEIDVSTLLPSSGAVPCNGYDAVSQAAYTSWDVNDEARFSVRVPENYLAGANFSLNIRESTSSATKKHKWQVTTLLLRPGAHQTDEQAESETFASECESSAVEDLLTARSFDITGASHAGRISDTAISAGDLLCLTMKRISASDNEDPDPIKVFDLWLSMSAAEATVSACAGRTGKIVDTVRDLFNESTGGFISDDFILRSINRCRQDLAQAGYWRREAWISAASGQNRIDLLMNLPDYQDLHQIHFSGQVHPMTALPGFEAYQELKTGSNTPGTPEYYVVQNDSVYVWPPPQTNLRSGYCIYYSYLPEDITCSSANPNPPIPKAHDMVFVYYVLKQAFLRDRHAPGADVKFNEYARLYEMEKQALLGEADPPRLSLRSYR